ncbi:MrcB family domain-containing protein [Brevundimonas sp.]|uniref:MrcB family domain-containing protein n=1 Tax=Brevundimonas sp. TaxID=1871086 RepID=UPI003567EEA3
MARYNPHRNIEPVLAAAAQWRDQCLLSDDSILTDEQSVWTQTNIQELKSAFIGNPDEGGDSFVMKLRGQLSSAGPGVIQLASEMLWVMLLFPSNIGADKKRETIEAIASWAPGGRQLKPNLLGDDVLAGIGSTGVGFNTHRWRELAYLITIAEAAKALGSAEREAAFKDPWAFARFLASVSVDGTRQLSHVLEYLLFPDTFERVSTGEDKRKIIVGLTDEDPRRVTQWDREARDRRLLKLRQELGEERGNRDFDFYEAELAGRWQNAKAEKNALFAGITAEDLRLLRESRRHAKYAELTTDELHGYQRIHKALGQLGGVVLEMLGGSGFQVSLTSGYTPQSGVRGYIPKDLWFGVYAKANDEAFGGHPQIFMIASERGLEFGFAAVTHPSDFSNALFKNKVRDAAPAVFNLLPAPHDPVAIELEASLAGGPVQWDYRVKQRLEPHKSDLDSVHSWLKRLRDMRDFRDAGGSISGYLTETEVDAADLVELVRSMTLAFRPIMERAQAGKTVSTQPSPAPSALPSRSIGDTLASAISQLEKARKQPFETVPELWETMTTVVELLDALPSVKSRPQIFAKWSLGKGVWAKVPWIALMNRNVTTSTQEGLYVVFLVAEDLSRIYLTLNQGMTQLVKLNGEAGAVRILRERASAYRAAVSELASHGFTLSDQIDLKTDNSRAKNYQPSTIAFAEFAIDHLPTNEALEAFLEPLLAAYDRLVDAEDGDAEPVMEEYKEAAAEAAPFSIDDAMEKLFLDREQFEQILTVWQRKKNIVLQGAPGVGKSYIARFLAYTLMRRRDDARIENIQFHQSYSYEDFIQGFRPTESGGFERRDGVFYRFCKKAAADPTNVYVFIIDEMNRGNLSKIFGELMLLIEADKRNAGYGTQLAYAREGEAKFYVPDNLHVLGMMNTADRSLSMVDYALRRRFAFVTLEPAFSSPRFKASLAEQDVTDHIVNRLVSRMVSLNDEIGADSVNLGPGYRIGHSFFVPKDSVGDSEAWYREVVETEIAPLLEEYWFDAPDKASTWTAELLATP